MKHLLLPVLALLAAAPALAVQAPGPAGFEPPPPPEDLDYRARARTHYWRAIRELERADVAHLTDAQRAARAELVEELRRYRARGEFGRNTLFPLERMPYFVDAGGRRCAVANLLDVSGERDYVLAVAAERNNHYVCELADDPVLGAWLDRVGLSLTEAARIHVPVPPPASDIPQRRRGPGTNRGPGDTVGVPNVPGASGPAVPATGGPGTPSAPARPRIATPATGGPGMDPRLAAIPTASTVVPDWWTWWEMNKLEFLSPNMLRMAPTSGYAYGDDLPPVLSRRLRGELLPLLREGLADPNAQVRAAATVAMGRVAGPEATPLLEPMLDDPDLAVRRRALLALGATGSKPAVALLLEVAESGDEARGEYGGIAPNARALAIVALGLARRHGAGEEVDAEVAEIVSKSRRRRSSELNNAILIYHQLAPGAATRPFVESIAEGRRDSVSERCRAIELNQGEHDNRALARLTRELHGASLDRRRSAALSIGKLNTPLALPTLKTGFEIEKEALTRGFLLISIGRQGGPDAREYLVDAMREEPAPLRPWCALALGILARADDDAQARAALREAFEDERNASSRGAFLLAFGIAGDSASMETCARYLDTAGEPRLRMHAALAVAMIGGPRARSVLLERLADEESEPVRVVIGHGLGTLGDSRDAKHLVGLLRDLEDPALHPLTSVALGFHGTGEALMGLFEIARSPRTTYAGRAGALSALGMLLDERSSLELAQISVHANFTVFPYWVNDLLDVTL